MLALPVQFRYNPCLNKGVLGMYPKRKRDASVRLPYTIKLRAKWMKPTAIIENLIANCPGMR
jgi:hypothetical protein